MAPGRNDGTGGASLLDRMSTKGCGVRLGVGESDGVIVLEGVADPEAVAEEVEVEVTEQLTLCDGDTVTDGV